MDFFVSIAYFVCGISYTILAGKGKYFAFIFGLISSFVYSCLAYKNALWGNFALNFLYYIPIQILSLIKWIKNVNPKTKSIYKTTLNKKIFLIHLLISIVLSLFLSYLFFINHDKSPILDGFITILSILGAFYTMKRVIEQWIIWSVVNILTMVLWFSLGNYLICLLWLLYLILGIVFYFQWRLEIKPDQQ